MRKNRKTCIDSIAQSNLTNAAGMLADPWVAEDYYDFRNRNTVSEKIIKARNLRELSWILSCADFRPSEVRKHWAEVMSMLRATRRRETVAKAKRKLHAPDILRWRDCWIVELAIWIEWVVIEYVCDMILLWYLYAHCAQCCLAFSCVKIFDAKYDTINAARGYDTGCLVHTRDEEIHSFCLCVVTRYTVDEWKIFF